MNVIRTPDERFSRLPEFPFEPHYLEVPDAQFGSLRMHYLDEGPSDGTTILLLGSQGCWAYMYRSMVPVLAQAGYRVIAPDYIGFGRSDKLPDTEDYTFDKHVGWLKFFMRSLELQAVTAYLFDWGGFFGLRIAGENPEFFERIVLSNTNMPMGPTAGTGWFLNWRTEQFALPEFPQGEMVNDGVFHKLSPETIAAYDAPYIDESYKTGPRRFPMILPVTDDSPAIPANRAAWEKLAGWEKPVLTLYSAQFKGTAMGPERVLDHIPGTRGQAHALIEEAGFYIVEDQSAELARRILEFMRA
jgi:haloalkane dehalogenase